MNSSWKTLIDPEILASHLGRRDLVILDCRFSLSDTDAGRRSYFLSHIPGAQYVDLDQDLSGPVVTGATGRHPLPAPESAESVFRSFGVNEGSQVVAYDDFGGAFAARAWWMLNWLGHDTVAVLNGGWPGWIEAGYPINDSRQLPLPGSFTFDLNPQMLVSSDQIDAAALDPDRLLIDARSHERFLGLNEPLDHVAGHIPGARSSFFRDNLDDNGNFRPKQVLKQQWKDKLGAFRPADVVSYCGSGVTGAHNVLAIRHAGLGFVALYAGSWSDWITRSEREIETGPANI